MLKILYRSLNLSCCGIKGNNKKFSSKYAEKTYLVDNIYYFDAKDKFYKEFNDANTFDAQVYVVSKFIDDVCLYYLKP